MSTTTTPTPNPVTQNSTIQVNVGDSPSDRIMAFATNINAMVLTNSNGTTVPIVSSSTPIEMMRLMGTMQPMAVLSIPQGTYTGCTITLSSMSITYMDPGTHSIVQKSVAGPIMTTVPLNPNLMLGSTPMVLSLDMNMASSVNIDASGNVTVAPAFQMAMNPIAAGSAHDPEHGDMEHLIGAVSNVSGNSFGISMMQSAQALNFSTTSSTQLENMGGMGMMASGVLVMVDATLQADGSLQAQMVHWFGGNGGVMADGIIGSVNGNPATQIGMIVQNGAGQGMMSSFLSNNVSASLSGTAYHINSDDMDMSNLPFTPTFDANHIFAGERIRCVSNSGMGSGMGGMGGGGMMGSMNAAECDLVQQGLSGTVSNYTSSGSQATFTLTLAADCYFATMTGMSAITVYQQPGTELYGMSTVANGQEVHVRGLVFNDNGVFRMVASRILQP